MVEPNRAKYNKIDGNSIKRIHVTVTDSIGRLVNLNGVDWYMTLLLREVKCCITYDRRSEYRRMWDPKQGKHVKKSIYGDGFFDAFSSIASALSEPAKKAVTGLVESGAKKVGEELGQAAGENIYNKMMRPKEGIRAEPKSTGTAPRQSSETAGDKIVELLHKKQSVAKPKSQPPITKREVNRRIRHFTNVLAPLVDSLKRTSSAPKKVEK